MSEREFELYLSLLGRFLGLSAKQRLVITDELRDHLEIRLEELIAGGLSRDEAITQALGEFGDAAELAQHFKYLAFQRRRRFFMRSTIGTITVLAASLLVAVAFWPAESTSIPAALPQAVAQAAKPATTEKTGEAEGKEDREDKDIERLLDQTKIKLDFVDTPLKEAVTFIGDMLKIDVILDKRLEDLGVSPDSPITLSLNKREIRARTALEFILQQASPEIDFFAKDGVLTISTSTGTYVTEVYHIANLISNAKVTAASGAGGLGGGGLGPAEGGGGGTPGSGADQFGAALSPAEQLRQVVTATVSPSSWSEAGGEGSASVFGNLLVIKHSPKVQREIRNLLIKMEMTLKEAKNAKP